MFKISTDVFNLLTLARNQILRLGYVVLDNNGLEEEIPVRKTDADIAEENAKLHGTNRAGGPLSRKNCPGRTANQDNRKLPGKPASNE
jgi:hypothetical protein